uniref:AH domain-containing protein n=1 Tax=Panagrolaimus sp. ES5 TaxID=591445 RepID=A0AC34GCH5_9BILA
MSKALNKLKQNYLTATQLALSQIQSPAEIPTVEPEFERKHELCMSTKASNFKLLSLVQKLANQMIEFREAEQDLDHFLSKKCHRPKLQKTLDVVGRVMAISAADRSDQITALSCLREDCEDLAEGGIADFAADAETAETARITYADSLVHMKKATENLNPEQYSHMNQFRQIQAMVRENKQNFDELQAALEKLDDLTNLREKVLESFSRAYLQAQLSFYERQYTLCFSVHNALLEHELSTADDNSSLSTILNNAAKSAPGPSKQR